MILENQVCTLEQAKRLKELGIEQCGYFSWQHFPEMIYRVEAMEVVTLRNKEGVADPGESWSAFTVAELAIMLPSPSIGNFQLPCKSHYIITKNKANFV